MPLPLLLFMFPNLPPIGLLRQGMEENRSGLGGLSRKLNVRRRFLGLLLALGAAPPPLLLFPPCCLNMDPAVAAETVPKWLTTLFMLPFLLSPLGCGM